MSTMHFSRIAFFLTFYAFHKWYAISDECGALTHIIKHNGKVLEDHVIEVLDNIKSLTTCWGLCTRRYDCKSLNYAESLSVCEFNSETKSMETDLSNDTRYVYLTTVDTGSCEDSVDDVSQPECCPGGRGSYNLQQRSCPAASANWCTCLNGFTGPMCTSSEIVSGIASSCKQYQEGGHTITGVLQINPSGSASFDAICDMDTNGGGWTILQRRSDGSRMFNTSWDEYLNGFGSLDDEFWLGLVNIYQLTGGTTNGELRVELINDVGNHFYALYSFGIVENTLFRARFTYIDGNAGDGLSYHDNEQFSTHDITDISKCVDDSLNELNKQDNYLSPNTTSEPEEIEEVSCSVYSGGSGWWFKSGQFDCADCFTANLNAQYDSLLWGQLQNIRKVEIKYRK